MISSDQISVIVQGAVGNDIELCINSIRHQLPMAEIILSTWEGSQIPQGLAVDITILNKDPGARPFNLNASLPNNTNRQLISTIAGLRQATRPYTLKLRTDFQIVHTGFLQAFTCHHLRTTAFIHYREKIVIPHYSTRFPESATPYPFHPSDLCLFGMTEDLIKHFDVPLLDESDWDWALNRADKTKTPHSDSPFRPRFAPEQHFFVHSLRAHGHAIPIQHHHDVSGDIPQLSRQYLVNNFVVLDMHEFGVTTQKPTLAYAIDRDIGNCYSSAIYRAEYRLWCDPNAPLHWRDALEARLVRNKRLHEKFVKHHLAMRQHALLMLENPPEGRFSHGHKMLADGLSTLYYFLRAIV
jgi:hypothetical protein